MDAQDLKVEKEKWGETEDGRDVYLFTLENSQKLQVQIMSLGGVITSIKMPDRNGTRDEITLGFDDLASYLKGHPKFGSIMGRVTNRTKNASFVLDGKKYQLEKNAGLHHMHGGSQSFDKRVWQAQSFKDADQVGVDLLFLSPDGDGGFPGNVEARVRYTLNNRNELGIKYMATTDAPTHVNMTNHAYFNLSGAKENIYNHQITIHADYYTDADDTAMPNGQILQVEGTPLDLREPTKIGERIGKVGSGFDHNYVINKEPDVLSKAAEVFHPESGRMMKVFTTQPGVQFYSANWKDRAYIGKGGAKYGHHYGIALETQHFPASANYPHFPSTVLRPGEKYEETVVFEFSVED
ncbi:MAG: galactose mutarotase [Saprospiraceae bacterium]|nr:galactose mutarotase [Saprospiraceae bacterium]